MERSTSQKRIIKEYLKSTKNHPSAKEVYLAVREQLPNISVSTVYRILKNFSENGEALEIKNNISRFDADLRAHSHFVCKRCGKVFDIDDDSLIISKKPEIKYGKIESCQVYFYGICKSCE